MIVKIFADLKVLHRNLSQLSLSVAVIDDATVWIGLSAIAAVIHFQQGGGWSAAHRRRLRGAGRHWLCWRPCWRSWVALRRSELRGRPAGTRSGAGAWCLAAAAFITLGAVITEGIRLDFTLGAFACGVIVASDRLVPVAMLRPLRTVVLWGPGPVVPGGERTVGRSAGPGLSRRWRRMAVIALRSGRRHEDLRRVRWWSAAGMDHPSAMAVGSALERARHRPALVVAAAGLRLGLITTEGFTILVLVALVTSAMDGLLIRRFLTLVPETPEEIERARLID